MARSAAVVTIFVLGLSLTHAVAQQAAVASTKPKVEAIQSKVGVWRGVVQNVKVDALNVSYQDGRLLEEARSLSLEHIGLLEKYADLTAKATTLNNQVQLLLELQETQSSVMDLSVLLGALTPPPEKASGWSQQLINVGKEMEPVYESLSADVSQNLKDADARLASDSCKSK